MDPAQAIEMTAMSRQKAVIEVTARGDSDVQMFYKDAVVFITGVTGFLGKALIEKLLRSCQISKVYMLLRPKKGKHIQERFNEVFQDPAFDYLHKHQPSFMNKILPVEGDVSEIRLGISDDVWCILTKQVDVIFHAAATTRFDEALKLATLINVRGTRETLLLGKSCKKLRSFVHISTAYSNASKALIGGSVYEKFYDAPIPPDTMISLAENLNPETLTNITEGFIEGWPNTYTFTKCITEELIRNTSGGLPICIVKPAIVLSAYREPAPGWMDMGCVYGATGLLVGGALGIQHTLYGEFNLKFGIIPSDYVINATIVAGTKAAKENKGGNDTKIYTVSSAHRNPTTWGETNQTLLYVSNNFPTPLAVYNCFLITTPKKWLYVILAYLLHTIPAYIADFTCHLIGREKRFVKIANKVYNMTDKLSYFLNNEWDFVDDNLKKLFSDQSESDKTIFNFDIPNINWTEYVILWGLGTRKYILKDGLKNTEYAIKKQKYLKVLHYIVMVIYAYVIYKMCYFIFKVASLFI